MSDFSLFSLFTAGLALFAPLATAYTQPVGDSPKGNPISQPGLNSLVPAGKPFTVTWDPTTQGSVTLVLLKGPSTDAEPQYAIAEEIPNIGTYVWVPSKDLEPTTDATGYGIQLICDSDGQYQYTTQFGISNPSYDAADASSSSSSSVPSTSSSVSSAASSASGYAHGAHGAYGHGGWGHGGHNVHAGYTHSAAWASTTGSASSTASSLTSSYAHGANGTATAGHAHSTGSWMHHNVTMVAPTGGSSTSKVKPVHSMSASGYGGSGSSASASTPAGPQATGNGAAAIVSSFGGLVLAAGAVVLAL